MSYEQTRARVATYFDQTATEAWAKLTSEASVSRIRETVRAGRDAMRAKLLSQLPQDMCGMRVLDAGCGFGQLSQALAERGALITAIDIAPSLLTHAQERMPTAHASQVSFAHGDFLDPKWGHFDATIAMDSMIYYRQNDLVRVLDDLSKRSAQILFTVAPKTPLLTIMWAAGQFFPRSDRSPTMVPHAPKALQKRLSPTLQIKDLGRVHSGFYISHALEARR